MKVILVIVLLFFYSKSHAQAIIELGTSIEPNIYLLPSAYPDKYSFVPKLNISLGNENAKAILLIGNYSKVGASITTEWFYTNATYDISLFNKESEGKHGGSIEIGFNCNLKSKCNFHRIQIGMSLGLLGGFDRDYIEVYIQPISLRFLSKISNNRK